MKQFVILFLSGILLMSCKPKPATEQSTVPEIKGDYSAYENEIMKIHDKAMSKMSELNQLETQLRNIRIKASQSDLGSSAIPEGIDATILSVKKAQSDMLDWMETYSATKPKIQEDLMLKFMDKELQKVTLVSDNIDNILTKAKEWLAAHPDL